MPTHPAVEVSHVSHRYGMRLALSDVTFDVEPGEIFALLGPNGGGKTTLFRLLSTLIPLTDGTARILGRDVLRETAAVRAAIGVVFQAPSLDRKLSVMENLRHQAVQARSFEATKSTHGWIRSSGRTQLVNTPYEPQISICPSGPRTTLP